jgi:phage-related protein
MLNETFYLDGVDARSAGINLQSPLKFSEAIPIVEVQNVPGRNGNIVFETGSYENRSGSASCFCLQENVEKAVSEVGRFLTSKKGYRRLETSDDPDHYWMARVENTPQIAMRVNLLSPFEISFDCKPQRFLKSGEEPIIPTKGGRIYNPYGQIALPLIKLYGTGSGTLVIGDCVVKINSIEEVLYLDSDTQNAYNNNGNQNMNISAPVFPFLGEGNIDIIFTKDIEKVEIIPRWWEL